MAGGPLREAGEEDGEAAVLHRRPSEVGDQEGRGYIHGMGVRGCTSSRCSCQGGKTWPARVRDPGGKRVGLLSVSSIGFPVPHLKAQLLLGP